MNFNLTLIMQAVAFTAFIWFCARFIWPPLMRAIETRQKQIADGLAAGEQGRKDLASAEKRDAQMLTEAKSRSAEIVAIGEKFKAETIEQAKIEAKAEGERIIAAAKEGKSLLELSVYDGSDTGEKVYNTLTVIGQPIPGDRTIESPDPSTTNDQMKSLTRWPVTVSYYDRDARAKDGEQTPVYAMSFELFENGVSRALVLDYNDFVISGALGKFDVKDSKPCK